MVVLCAANAPAAHVFAQEETPAPAVAEPAVAESSPAEANRPVGLQELRSNAEEVPWYQRAISLLGIAAMIFIAWLLSYNRRKVPWRVIGWGVGLQLTFGVLVLKTDAGMTLFSWLNDAVTKLLEFTNHGSSFIFGDYLDFKFSIALQVLPTIIFFSSLMSVLYHLGLIQRVVKWLAILMQKTMGTSGSETLSASANIFVGQTEAPLVVKPYVHTMTQSELMAVMVGGFATVAGGVLAAYVGMLQSTFPDIAGHLIAASVMSAPAALVIAKVLLPETEESPTAGEVSFSVEKDTANLIDAAARGAGEGLKLALNVGAMLLAFLALIALVNYLLGVPVMLFNEYSGGTPVEPITLQEMLGYVFYPIAFLMGVATEDCAAVGGLLGEKMVLTEFVAFLHLGEILSGTEPMNYRSTVIATYALCGFANFGSIAIQIGGIGGIAPERRTDLAKIGLRAMIGGMLAACMTATVAGILI